MSEHPPESGNSAETPHTQADSLGDRFVEVWQHPKVAFLLGVLVSAIVIGSIAVSPPVSEGGPAAERIGEQTVSHYETKATSDISYELLDVEQHSSGLYKVTVAVQRGTVSSQESVYVTQDGKYTFTTPPERVRPELTR